MSAHELWWTLLQHRIDMVRPGLPRGLRGTIQFVDTSGEHLFHLVVDGPCTRAACGNPGRADTRVVIDTSVLERVIASPAGAGTAFRVGGNCDLYQEFFASLNAVSKPLSLVATRNAP